MIFRINLMTVSHPRTFFSSLPNPLAMLPLIVSTVLSHMCAVLGTAIKAANSDVQAVEMVQEFHRYAELPIVFAEKCNADPRGLFIILIFMILGKLLIVCFI